MTTEPVIAEPGGGTEHLIGVRASFKTSKELLAEALEEDISQELREKIVPFLAQFDG